MTTSGLPRQAAAFAAFCLSIFLLGHFAVELAPTDSDVAAWWPAAGVSVAVVARFHRYRWWFLAAIVVVSGIANLTGGRPITVAAGFAISNAAEAFVAGAWMNRRRRPALERVADVWEFVLGAALGAITIGIGAAATVGLFLDGDMLQTMRNVVPSHAAAVLLIAPFALASAPTVRRSRLEVVGLWSLSVLATLAVFWPGQALPLAFVSIPMLMWSAVRLGVRSVSAQLVVVGMIATFLTARDGGAFARFAGDGRGELADPISLVQLFIMTNAVVLITLAVALGDRERAMQRATASEMLYRAGFVEALAGMVLVRLEPGRATVTEINAAAADLLPVQAGDALPDGLETDDGRPIGELIGDLAPGEGRRAEMRIAATDRWCNVSATRLAGVDEQRTIALQLVDTTRRHAVERELEDLALRDPLTGLPNRAALARHLDDALANASDGGAPAAVMFLDIDDFKVINDVFGHVVGDEVLREVAGRLQSIMRVDDLVARIGGDEFVIVCRNAGTPEIALRLAERVWDATEEAVPVEHLSYGVSFSVGVTLSTDGATSGQLLSEADAALYAAKAAGKRRITLYSDDLGERTAREMNTVTELRDALARNEFEMYMQPVVDVSSGEVTAAEALIRWNHPTDGLRAPFGWLEVAERSGLMPELGEWVLEDSVRQAAHWIDVVGVDRAPVVHVNVSPYQLDRPGFAELVLAILDRYALPPHQLVLELTETFLAQVSGALVAELETLTSRGIRVAADDFGTGYSPLTRVVELPVGMIKIDRSFIGAMPDDHRSQGIVGALVGLAHELRLDVVAEGVETDAQLAVIRRLGCDVAQGYLWSRPVPAREFESMIVAGHVPAALGDG